MIDAEKYIEVIKKYYSFLVNDFGLSVIKEDVRGNFFYDVKYGDEIRTVSISYENIEDYFQVTIFILQDGKTPNYDDKTNTLHLNNLNYTAHKNLDKNDVHLNNHYFSSMSAENNLKESF